MIVSFSVGFFDETIRNGSLFAIFTTIFGLQSSGGSGFDSSIFIVAKMCRNRLLKSKEV